MIGASAGRRALALAGLITVGAPRPAAAAEFVDFRRLSIDFTIPQTFPAQFGAAVGIDGPVTAIGAPYGDGSAATMKHGLVAIYRNGATSVIQEPHLTGPLPASAFGWPLALSLPLLAVNAATTGVHIYRRTSGLWGSAEAVLAPPPAVASGFGLALALGDGLLLVGATNPGGFGHVFPYHHDVDLGWIADPPIVGLELSSSFGAALALRDDLVAIGAPTAQPAGAVRLATLADGVWSLLPEPLTPALDPTASSYGAALALAGTDLLAVGAPDSLAGAGAVFVYRREALVWELRAILRPPADAEGPTPRFGAALGFIDGSLAVGAPGDGTGRVYVHNHPELAEPADLVLSEPLILPGANFGVTLAASGRRLIVGAPATLTDPLMPLGSAFGYDLLHGLGAPCVTDDACESDRCVDGVCCESACDGPCMRCAVAGGGEVDGVCGPLICVDDGICVDADDACAPADATTGGASTATATSGPGDPPTVGLDPWEGGCGCRGGGASAPGPAGLLLAGLALGLTGRRRRRRRAPRA